MKGLTIRDYRSEDAAPLAELFFDAVQRGAAGHYDATQRAAWCSVPPSGARWSDRLGQADTVVAEHDGRLVGFMTLDPVRAYLDLAFVAPDMMGKGVAGPLYAVLESRARAASLTRLSTEASLLAERFFRRQGWQLVTRQVVERNGVSIPNARMEKQLHSKVVSPA